MPRKAASRKTDNNRWVHTSGVSAVDLAVEPHGKGTVGASTDSKVHQLSSVGEPLPSQCYTFQRGLAKAALEMPEPEREQMEALAEVLAMMGLLRKVV